VGRTLLDTYMKRMHMGKPVVTNLNGIGLDFRIFISLPKIWVVDSLSVLTSVNPNYSLWFFASRQ